MENYKIVLYWYHGSQPSWAVKSLLLAGEIVHETKELNIFANEHKSPEMLALNPRGQVPFITFNGTPINESASILRFLARRFPSLYNYYPQPN